MEGLLLGKLETSAVDAASRYLAGRAIVRDRGHVNDELAGSIVDPDDELGIAFGGF